MPLLNLTDSDFAKLRAQSGNGMNWLFDKAIVPTDNPTALAGALRNAGVREDWIAKVVPDAKLPSIIIEVRGGVAEVVAASVATSVTLSALTESPLSVWRRLSRLGRATTPPCWQL
jgi:hypothetical protein